MRSVMAWTVGRIGARPLRICAAWAAVILFAATMNVRAQQSVPAPAPPAAANSTPAPTAPPDKSEFLTLAPKVVEITLPDGRDLKLGASCERHTDNFPGVLRSDPCHRWYCGRADKKSISQEFPHLAEETGCTWRVEASNQCVCRNLTWRRIPGYA